LQAYFNQRLSKILTKHGKKMIGWDEILHPDLPKDIVVQSWRGPQSLAEAAKKGYTGILSNGYYIDLIQPAWQHYLNDLVPENTTLTPEEQKLILGGEATMWSEWVSPETIDSRTWPRTAAIAERFWSPREVKDVDDMYRRLAAVSVQLEDVGLLHEKNQEAMLRRWINGAARTDEIKPLIAIVEPVKDYLRGSLQKATQFTPLTRLADIARPDSEQARNFTKFVDQYLYSTSSLNQTGADPISGALGWWKNIAAAMNRYIFPSNQPPPTVKPRPKGDETVEIDLQVVIRAPLMNEEAAPLAKDMEDVCDIGLEAYGFLQSNKIPNEEWLNSKLARLIEAAKPKAAVELMIVQPVMELVAAAAEQEKRKTMSVEEWKKHVKTLTAEKKKPRLSLIK